MKSFSLLRTNTGLTTNMKIMVDSNYAMYLESIDSMPDLSSTKYKKVLFNKENYFDELIPYFYNKLPTDISFSIKYDRDNDNMSNNFSNQYDDIYQMGARNILDNKNYSEEFECFAPLYVNKYNLPKGFVIFRVDGPGLITLNKDNFRTEILNKLKCVKLFDLSKKTPLGEWMDRNFTSNRNYPATPFELDFKRLEFSKWNGINYDTGGHTYKSFFLDSTLEIENPLFDLDKFVFDGYKNNKVVFPHILNLSFLFDDTPATPMSLRKWSINRYFGFYLDDIDQHDAVTPNLLPKLKNDVVVSTGNIIYSTSSEYPFVEEWKDTLLYYVEYKGNFYKVEKFTQTLPTSIGPSRRSRTAVIFDQQMQQEITRYRIIADIDLTGKQSEINTRIVTIDENNYLKKLDLTYYQIPDFDTADIWLIEIDGVLHNLIKDGDKIKVYTDYAFSFPPDKYEYWINKPDTSYKKTVNLIITQDNAPKNFKIYRLKFTDIKDFDTAIIDTEYSKFEYEKKSDLTLTDETKMYTVDLRSTSNPKEINDYNYKNMISHIPTSSEYTANYETFRIFNSDLTELWRKNNTYCRWVYQGSLSANDYPYLMNNSSIFEDFNRTTNPFDPDPKRFERNLDYFYTINASTSSYVHHSLHVENNTGGVPDSNFKFEIDKYLGLGTYSGGTYSFDYFTYFFDRKTTFDSGNIVKSVNKYSIFNAGDNVIPNTTLFRGLKFRVYDVDTVKVNQNVIENINLKNLNSFEDYKFSVLLSKNDYNITDVGITSSVNNMQWRIIENWEMDKNYASGSIVLFDDILYKSTQDTNTLVPVRTKSGIDVKAAPYNDTHWMTYTYSYGPVSYSYSGSPFWNPNTDYPALQYLTYDIVYNSGEYYQLSGVASTQSFWNPNLTYSTGDTVLYKNKFYKSTINDNIFPPNTGIQFRDSSVWVNNWDVTTSDNPRWVPIELWNPSISYSTSVYVVHNNIVYWTTTGTNIGDEPGISNLWQRVYSINQDTDFIYGTAANPFIEMNNKIYMLESNSSSSTLENGINIYINKKWKNILVNIFINDNTTTNLSGYDRDSLYTDLNKKITANNFIHCINDISNKYGFSDYLNYIIIDENGSISRYNMSNISDIKHILFVETPEELKTKINSLIHTPITLGKNIIRVKNYLKDGKILDLSQLNYYNEIPLAVDISYDKNDTRIVKIDHGIKNITNNQLYRHSGYYMPLFYNIELFGKQGITSSVVGNYKFDTSYTNFGTIKQRIISKVNRKENILKLKDNNSYKSIYPMIDEFGYTFVDFFMFKSTWDLEYHIECKNPEQTRSITLSETSVVSITQNINTNISL